MSELEMNAKADRSKLRSGINCQSIHKAQNDDGYIIPAHIFHTREQKSNFRGKIIKEYRPSVIGVSITLDRIDL